MGRGATPRGSSWLHPIESFLRTGNIQKEKRQGKSDANDFSLADATDDQTAVSYLRALSS